MNVPLSEELRPKTITEWVGQDHLIDYLNLVVQSGHPHSLLLYGPPGCGKTSLARLYASSFSLPFRSATAVMQSVSELKKILQESRNTPLFSKQVILFVDEIHRFNRAQQDIFLPFLEDGSLVLIGATTENPSFALNAALLSRLRVLTLKHLEKPSFEKILQRYESLYPPLCIDFSSKELLFELAQGDGRHFINMIETIAAAKLEHPVNREALFSMLQKRTPLYDKSKEGHYNLISAFHKSVRTSDPDSALYWLSRMLEGGEDPLFVARRLIRMALEDIGLADPQALPLALASRKTYEILGSPEGELALAQATVYLALAPKSNALYQAVEASRQCAQKSGYLDPPKQALNAPTEWMKESGYGEGYLYDHDTKEGCSGQNMFPEQLGRPSFYSPVERGFEREMKKRLVYFSKFHRS